MKKHVKVYLKYFRYISGFVNPVMTEFVPCEQCGKKSVDIHHIIFKSQGGTDEIENLIALCRKCHNMAHDNELTKSDLNMLHRRRMVATTGVMGKKL